MTDPNPAVLPPPVGNPIVAPPRKRRRVALWTLIVWTALCLVWAIAGANANHCASQPGDAYLSHSDAVNACQAGTGIAVFAIILIWALVVFVIAAITVIVRLGRR
jgi:hypothetical protein